MGCADRFDTIKKEFPRVLEESLGIVSIACKRLGVSRAWFYQLRNSDPEFKQECDDVNEVVLDFVEHNLHKNIKKGKEASTIFYLKTRGKNRGYVERLETTGKDGGPIKTEQNISEVERVIYECHANDIAQRAVEQYKAAQETNG